MPTRNRSLSDGAAMDLWVRRRSAPGPEPLWCPAGCQERSLHLVRLGRVSVTMFSPRCVPKSFGEPAGPGPGASLSPAQGQVGPEDRRGRPGQAAGGPLRTNMGGVFEL